MISPLRGSLKGALSITIYLVNKIYYPLDKTWSHQVTPLKTVTNAFNSIEGLPEYKGTRE